MLLNSVCRFPQLFVFNPVMTLITVNVPKYGDPLVQVFQFHSEEKELEGGGLYNQMTCRLATNSFNKYCLSTNSVRYFSSARNTAVKQVVLSLKVLYYLYSLIFFSNTLINILSVVVVTQGMRC